ncbi:hypothetical protein GM415_15465 [Pseudodesulfovibrio cashew]|uniref:Uncharacterized protein n=1 Tax=Pseudodesulfovibrio cashew TaxID=2678688 RepID=A0A6I6JUR3_9BACT|nr:hypothetical protein [Pseudodesulfovibrio cashew]QGY41454.1 hypothetical protein GM415_15465 [Pseudodesulfovibrio cashew]
MIRPCRRSNNITGHEIDDLVMVDWQCTGLGRSPADPVIRHNDTPNRSRRQDLGYDRRPVPSVAGYVLAIDDERSFPFPVARDGQRVAPGRIEDGSALLGQDPLVGAVGRCFALDDRIHGIGADERHGNVQFPGGRDLYGDFRRSPGAAGDLLFDPRVLDRIVSVTN